MAPSHLDKQKAGCKLPHIWVVRLAMDLATLHDMWNTESKTICRLAGYFQVNLTTSRLFSGLSAFFNHFMAFHHHPSYTSTCGIDYVSEKYI